MYSIGIIFFINTKQFNIKGSEFRDCFISITYYSGKGKVIKKMNYILGDQDGSIFVSVFLQIIS